MDTTMTIQNDARTEVADPLSELVTRIGTIRAALPKADQNEKKRIEKETHALLFELVNRAGDQLAEYLPSILKVVNFEMCYWRLGLDLDRQKAVADILERFHAQRPPVAPPSAPTLAPSS